MLLSIRASPRRKIRLPGLPNKRRNQTSLPCSPLTMRALSPGSISVPETRSRLGDSHSTSTKNNLNDFDRLFPIPCRAYSPDWLELPSTCPGRPPECLRQPGLSIVSEQQASEGVPYTTYTQSTRGGRLDRTSVGGRHRKTSV